MGNQRGVPVVEFHGIDLPEARWDSSDPSAEASGVHLSFEPASDLVSEKHPGEFRKGDAGSLWQPFENTEIVIKHPTVDGRIESMVIPQSDEGLVPGYMETGDHYLPENAGRALRRLYRTLIEENNGYHPAASGFIGRLHWYLACRPGDEDLIAQTHELMANAPRWERSPGDGLPAFTGPRAHHMNNYADYLTFYEATREHSAGC